MRRYAETFFRYWLIALIPLIVLPLATYVSVRHTPNTYLVTANIEVDQPPQGYTNQYESAAQNETDAIGEFLLSPSSIYSVITTGRLARIVGANNITALEDDIVKNVVVTPHTQHLVSVSYSGTDSALGMRIVSALLTAVQTQQRAANAAQNNSALTALNLQLHSDQRQATADYQKLHDYMNLHGDTQSDLSTTAIGDPTLDTLYQQYQTDVQAVQKDQGQISAARAQANLPSSASQQSVFTVKDPPYSIRTSSTKKKLIPVAIAAAIALLLAIAFIVTKTLSDRSLRYPDEAPELLGLPVLTVVPYRGAPPSRRGRTSELAAIPRGQLADA